MTVRVLWASPLPPVRSGVSDYAMELLPHLAESCRVRVVLPPGVPGDALADGCAPCAFVPAGSEPEGDEIPVLHIGNNPYHEWILPMLERGAPVVVLHDLVLHHLLVESTLGHGQEERYRELLTAAEAEAGPILARARRFGFAGRLDPFFFPALRPFLASARAVVVHSRWAAQRVRAVRPDLLVQVLPMPAVDPGPGIDRKAIRKGLGIAGGDLVLMHVGFLTPAKGLEEILGGMAAAWQSGIPVRLVLVGEGGGVEDIRSAARALGIEDRLLVSGWVAPELFPTIPAAADLGVVLRTPSAGETSAAVVRFLACGTPVAVGGLHQFLEWPLEAAPRLTPGPSAAADLARVLALVHREAEEGRLEERRRTVRRAYEQGGHRPAHVAALLADFFREVA